jgi:hypothetical protein
MTNRQLSFQRSGDSRLAAATALRSALNRTEQPARWQTLLEVVEEMGKVTSFVFELSCLLSSSGRLVVNSLCVCPLSLVFFFLLVQDERLAAAAAELRKSLMQ